MTPSRGHTLQRLLSLWIDGAQRRPLPIIAATVAVTLVAAYIVFGLWVVALVLTIVNRARRALRELD